MPFRSLMEISETYIQAFFNFWSSFLRFISLSLEIFLHKGFGERYFNSGALMAIVIVLFVYTNVFCFFQVLIFAVIFGRNTLLIHLFTYAVIVAGIAQLWLIHKRRKQGGRIHSWYSGDSFLSFLPLSQHVLQMYIEPGLCLVIGLFIPDLIFSQWVQIASISMFLVRRTEWARLDNFIHDILDQEIEAKYIQEAILERKTPKETEGFFVASSLHYPNIHKETFQDAVDRLDPGLKKLMKKSKTEQGKDTFHQEEK